MAKKSLLIQCDPETDRCVRESLADEGFDVKTVKSVREATILPKAPQLTLIVLDELAHAEMAEFRLLLDRWPNALLLVACSADNREAIQAVLRHHSAEFILKPFDGGILSRYLARFVRRQHVREQLEDSLQFIRRVADATPELIYLFDIEDECNVYVNRHVCAILGCTPEGIPPDGPAFFATIMRPDDLARVRLSLHRQIAEAENGEAIESEYQIRDAVGGWRWIHTRETVFSRTPDGRPKQILGTAQDITDRRELDETRAHLAAIVEHTSDAVIGKKLDGTIVSWNAAAQRMYGYTAEETIGQNISMLVPADHHDEIPDLLERIRRGEEVDDYDAQRVRKDGRTIRASINISPIRDLRGHITGASTIAREVTAKNEPELSESTVVDSPQSRG